MSKENHNISSWVDAWRIYTRPTVLGMVFFGFSAGLPYLLVFSTMTAWLTEEGVSRSAIGLFAWVGMTYSVKVIWAPIVDRAAIPFFWSCTWPETKLDSFWADAGGVWLDRNFHFWSQ